MSYCQLPTSTRPTQAHKPQGRRPRAAWRITDGDALNRLRALLAKVCVDFQSELVQVDSEDHHVHPLGNYPPKVAVSVNSLKCLSSRLLWQQRPDLAARYWKGVLCSRSYFAASCGGAPVIP